MRVHQVVEFGQRLRFLCGKGNMIAPHHQQVCSQCQTPGGQIHPLWLGGSEERNDLGVGYTWTPPILLGAHLVDNTHTARLERSEI